MSEYHITDTNPYAVSDEIGFGSVSEKTFRDLIDRLKVVPSHPINEYKELIFLELRDNIDYIYESYIKEGKTNPATFRSSVVGVGIGGSNSFMEIVTRELKLANKYFNPTLFIAYSFFKEDVKKAWEQIDSSN